MRGWRRCKEREGEGGRGEKRAGNLKKRRRKRGEGREIEGKERQGKGKTRQGKVGRQVTWYPGLGREGRREGSKEGSGKGLFLSQLLINIGGLTFRGVWTTCFIAS